MTMQKVTKASIKLDPRSKTLHTFEVGRTPTKTAEDEVITWDGLAGRIRRKRVTRKLDMPKVEAITAHSFGGADSKVAVRFAGGSGKWYGGAQLTVWGKEKT